MVIQALKDDPSPEARFRVFVIMMYQKTVLSLTSPASPTGLALAILWSRSGPSSHRGLMRTGTWWGISSDSTRSSVHRGRPGLGV